ncbi:hypothetical protein KP509_19G033500 [Ceratopteris richardii]|uniref:sterol 22-desaturase n=1 Tax=Ceratopteris richardii TaxID=49495 RepID=A0A8T2SMS5_CERRI|nr:hypothetical protein KP509_19G033500 [Ceratopteris richardii]
MTSASPISCMWEMPVLYHIHSHKNANSFVTAMEFPAWGVLVGCLLLGWIAVQQIKYLLKKQHLRGPFFILPFLGTALSLVWEPTKYWEKQAFFSQKTGISCNYIFGRFTVFIRDSEISQKVFANVRPDAFQLIGHPFGSKLFGDINLIFMYGDEHKDLRRRLAPLFTIKALATYVTIQERTIRSHIERWLMMASNGSPLTLRVLCRDMNLETSQNVFVGPYLTPEMKEQFTKDYNAFNMGVMALPLDFPGCLYNKAKHAVRRLVAVLTECARQSRIRMNQGEEPECLLDFWTKEILREIEEAEDAGLPAPPHTSEKEVGHHVFDFLFAAQDASTSSLVWAVTLLDSHPKVLEKVRKEQSTLSSPLSLEKIRLMEYTQMVVREVLRFRPPATLVPHVARVNFPITETYTIPKGTIVFPSVFDSSFQGFTDPHSFDPDRFSPERQEDQRYKRNWLVFGAGPHQCLGQRYAVNHLTLFTSLFTSMVEFTRVPTPGQDELVYTPTIAPKDHGFFLLSKRK